MIHLLPVSRVIAGIAVTYGVIIALIFWVVSDSNMSFTDSIGMALGGATIIHILLIALFFVGWKWLWAKFPVLNRLLFPDLNGVWEIKIHWMWEGNKGIAIGVAHIKQDFLNISMEVETDQFESESLCAKPAKDVESGRPILYYMYRVIPKQVDDNNGVAYEGSAILKLDQDCFNNLRGNYFTSRQTKGYFELSRNPTDQDN